MATVSDADEFSYIVPGWLWRQKPNTVLRNAQQAARRKRKQAVGDPDEEHVVLVWRQDASGTVAAAS